MGKGDIRSRRGKIIRGTFGNKRRRSNRRGKGRGNDDSRGGHN